MPFKKSKSGPTISQTIRRLIKEGYSRQQAAAIAFAEAGITKRKKRKFSRG